MLQALRFAHLHRLTDSGGLYEHALLTTPRREHGYCVDDVARALVLLSREAERDPLHDQYLDFLLLAQDPDGRFRNRRAADLTWSGSASVEDCWGRALWGLGAVVAHELRSEQHDAALEAFTRGASWTSPWPRARAFAALGAAFVLEVHPDHVGARTLLAEAARRIGRPELDASWPWPEQRLTYANAVVPEVLLAAGAAAGDPSLVKDGLLLLEWLVRLQTRDGVLSVIPVAGHGRGEALPGFDQQPIEIAALADACGRAHALTGDGTWQDVLERAAAWFLGQNDSGIPLYDSASGGGCDGLESTGRNENQGAESTLALLSTWQQAGRHGAWPA
ncbi:MAG: hypothetical protein JWL79_1029 [Frankiales bacterium]|nr:hypothetical protein [Frankiales bacterium]